MSRVKNPTLTSLDPNILNMKNTVYCEKTDTSITFKTEYKKINQTKIFMINF